MSVLLIFPVLLKIGFYDVGNNDSETLINPIMSIIWTPTRVTNEDLKRSMVVSMWTNAVR